MASIKQWKMPDGTIYDIKAIYDNDGNNISSTYQKRYRNVNNFSNGSTGLNGTLPPAIFAYKNGYPIHADPEFASGMNDIACYDNNRSGKTILSRIAKDCGNSSGYCIEIKNIGAGSSPSLGGWYFADRTTYARQLTCIFRALIPVGYVVNWHSNSIGSSGTSYWLTDNSGTGKWEWYAYHVDAGSNSFSSTMFFALDGPAGSDSSPVYWYLSYANTIINSYGNYDGLRVRYADTASNADTVDGYHVSGTWPISISGNAATASTLAGVSTGSWNPRGTTLVYDFYSGGGDMSISQSGGQISLSVDGFFYQNEGRYLCLDTSNYASTLDGRYLIKSGDTISGNIYIGPGGGRLNGSATNGGINSILIGDDVWLGDCNVGGALGLKSNNTTNAGFVFFGSDGSNYGRIYYDGSGGHSTVVFYGAAWNDYAEYRKSKIREPGRCIYELGDDELAISDKRMIPGCEIVSDTFGFAIGETDECKTPIATSGRVLAYPYESLETFKSHIGKPVCSGPNGTVSIMTDEEYKEKGYCAIGTISAVPDYETWGTGNVKVDGRVWIRIR